MNLSPIIGRELHATARQPFTYWLRTLGMAAALAVSLALSTDSGSDTQFGRKLFGGLHTTAFFAIWILVPFLAADCLSRERRDGTLGLLFLAGLRGTEVVASKSIVHGARALTIWLAVLPAFTIPILLGGVSWREEIYSALTNLSVLAWAMGASLLSSAWSRHRARAILGAFLLSFLFANLFAFSIAFAFQVVNARSVNQEGWEYLVQMIGSGFALIVNPRWLSRMFPSGLSLLPATTAAFAVSLAGMGIAVRLAGARLRRSWREEPPSARQTKLEQTFCRPVLWVSFLHSWMRRKLNRNPIGWLEQRSWSGRLVTWGWLAVVISLLSTATMDRSFLPAYSIICKIIGWLLAGSIAFTAAGSFRRERETGVLELLLISPLNEDQIIRGRLLGLWGQFAPAAVFFLLVWIYLQSLFPYAADAIDIFFCGSSFFTLPIIGLYYSLRCSSPIGAILCTLFIGLLVPVFVRQIFWMASDAVRGIGSALDLFSGGYFEFIIIPAAIQAAFAGVCWRLLRIRLIQRQFAWDRTNS